MKKILLITLICLISIISIGFFLIYYQNFNGYGKINELKLRIEKSSRSARPLSNKPKEIIQEYEIKLDKEYSADYFNIFTITEINNDNIVIKTKNSFSDNENGIDLLTKKTEFKIYLNKELKLSTPTMDAGNTYYFNLVK